MLNEHWISNGTAKPFYVRKKAQLRSDIRSAAAKVTGLGQFTFYVNAQKAGDHELDPGWTDYRRMIQYVSFDITALLKAVPQDADGCIPAVFGAEVGNGWFIKETEHYTFHFPGNMPENPNDCGPFGTMLPFSAEITVIYENGEQQLITTEESWRTAPDSCTMTNVYGSETIDGRLRQEGWCLPDFDDADWKPAVPAILDKEVEKAGLVDQFQPPVRVIRTYEGRFLHMANGRDIYDFGQNMSGILKVQLKAKKGDRVCIYPAEKLKEDGDVDQMAKNWMMIDTCITFIAGCDDVWETFCMKFTYFAGRYLAVKKIPSDSAAESAADGERRIEMRDLQAFAVTSAWKESGTFQCDDRRYQQIYDMIERSVEANMMSVHTDCPTIERFAWQEPNHLMAPSIFYMKESNRLWRKFFMDLRAAQHSREDVFRDGAGHTFPAGDGLVPSQAPCYYPNVLPVPGMGSFYDIIAWGSTCILGPYWHYRFYGDLSVIRENYAMGKRYLAYLKSRMTPEGFISHGLGDWGNPEQEHARENIETAFLYADASVLAEFAGLLSENDGNTEAAEDAAALRAFAGEVKSNYNDRLLKKDLMTGLHCYPAYDRKDSFVLTQACQALPLYWGMVPEQYETEVAQTLRNLLTESRALIAGEIGLPYVIQCANRYGMNDLIAECITRPAHPSYYAFVLDGETTLGEYWEKNPRSHCHDMMGHIVEWYYNGIAGIHPLRPGFGEVQIRPELPRGMHTFTVEFKAAAGRIFVRASEENGWVRLTVKTDPGIHCRICTDRLGENTVVEQSVY